jgi:hypothetical protein
MKFFNFINESSRFIITLNDIKAMTDSSMSIDAQRNASSFLDMWYDDKALKKDIGYYLNMFSKAGQRALQILGNVPYYSRKDLMEKFFQYTFLPEKEDDLWPIPIYISAEANDKNTIGILVYKNGKKEMFEGNDEASPETYELVDKILGDVKEVEVWGFHDENLVTKIKQTGELPKDLYMSPNKKYAQGYWSLKGDRLLFSGLVMSNAFRKESEVDWKTKEETKIKKVRIY